MLALELFDATFPGVAARGVVATAGADDAPGDYEFLGSFAPDDTLTGYACFGQTPGTDATYDLYWIAVDPARHGSGTGTRLLGEVERQLASRSARLLVVETSSRADYGATRHFYERRGYHRAARVADFYAPGDDRLILTKRISHRPTSTSTAASAVSPRPNPEFTRHE